MNPQMPKHDPFLDRERNQYEQPIASREYILSCLKSFDNPMNLTQLSRALDLEEGWAQQALARRLRAMVRDGQLIVDNNHGYRPLDELPLVQGELFQHREGFGLLKVNGMLKDLFVSPDQMHGYLSGDWVLARVCPSKQRRQEARLVKLLFAKHTEFMGRVIEEEGVRWVEPHILAWPRRFVAPALPKDIKAGTLILAHITARPSFKSPGSCEVREVLGDPSEPGMVQRMACLTHQIPSVWPEQLRAEMSRLERSISEAERADRVDLTDKGFVTIDGADARDFDDAVYGERLEGGEGWQIWVAIADVAHHVTAESLLDLEAQRRGTSVYFPQAVIPMLPELLSNDLCSLNPHEVKRVMVCRWKMRATGEVHDPAFFEALISSRARLTYDAVEEAFNKAQAVGLRKEHPTLDVLREVYHLLNDARLKRGALELETEEMLPLCDPQGKCLGLRVIKRGVAHRLIEALMIQANVLTAQYLLQKKAAGLFRVHDKPDEFKVALLKRMVEPFAPQVKKLNAKSPAKAYDRVIQTLRNHDAWPIAQTLMLRSLKPARYDIQCQKHFGLALQHYTHFTSPIRRYPDLVVHRILKYLMRRGQEGAARRSPHSREALERIAQQSTQHEKRADMASREVMDATKCQFIQGLEHHHASMMGMISGFNVKGLFVRLSQWGIDGFLPIENLPSDLYKFCPLEGQLRGQHHQYKLGDRLSLRVVSVSPWKREILLKLSENLTSEEKPCRKRRRSSSKAYTSRSKKGGDGLQ